MVSVVEGVSKEIIDFLKKLIGEDNMIFNDDVDTADNGIHECKNALK